MRSLSNRGTMNRFNKPVVFPPSETMIATAAKNPLPNNLSTPSPTRTSMFFRSAILWTFAVLASLSATAPALAEVKSVTISRTGANSASFSVSNDATGGYHSQMHYTLVDSSSASCSDSTLTYGNASSTWSGGGQTYSKTITGNVGKYICIRGTRQASPTQASVTITKGVSLRSTIRVTLESSLASGSAGNSWQLIISKSGSDRVDSTNKRIYINQSSNQITPANIVGYLNGLNGVSATAVSGGWSQDWRGTHNFSGGHDGSSGTDYSTPQGPIAYSALALSLNSAGADKVYETGDNIDVTAAFGYNVTVTGSPRIALTIGSAIRYATYNSGSGSGNLKFRYTVVATDQDGDGLSIAANALSLNSGTIQDSGSTNAPITHAAVATSANRLVNAVPHTEAPTFRSNASIDDVSVIQNRLMRAVSFPRASGGDGKLSYSVTPSLPTGLTLEASTGLLHGTPTTTSTKATYTYTVSDEDTNTASSDKDTVTFSLEVLGENTLRVFHEIGDGFLRKNGRRTFALDYVFNGPSTTTYSASSSDSTVATATVSDSTLTLTGVKHGIATITLTAAATGQTSVSQSFEVEIYGQNNAPIWSGIPDISVQSGQTVTLDLYVYVSDPEGTSLSFTATSGDTSKATVALAQTSILTITPVATGSVTIGVTASDGYYQANDTFTLTISSSNSLPSFASGTSIADQSLTQNVAMTTLSLPAASGGDGELSYSLNKALPAGLVFDAEARTISGAPTATATSSTYTYTVADSDNITGSSDEDTLTFAIVVAAKNTTPPTVTKVSYHTWDNAHDPSATSLTGPHQYGKALIVRFTFDKAMDFILGDTDSDTARPAFIGMVDGKEGLKFRVVDRINGETHEIPDQCAPFYPHLDSHTVFQCLVTEPAWHLHGFGNLPSNNFQYTIRVLRASADLGGTSMASDHTPTAITIDPVGPTVTSAGYYSDAATTTVISGSPEEGDDVYTKVVFSENVTHKAATDGSARPHMSYYIGGSSTGTQFDVVATSETLESGECKPNSAPPSNTYTCMYTVADGDTGSFDFVVAASAISTALGGGDLLPLTTDIAGNILNATVFKNHAGTKYSSRMSLSNGLNLNGLRLFGLKLASPLTEEPAQASRTVWLQHDMDGTTGCLDVQWGKPANGQNVWTYWCNGTAAQEWTLEQRTTGTRKGSYRLVSGVGDSNYCLDNRGDFHDGGRMGIWACVADDHDDVENQSFELSSSTGGRVLTFSRNGAKTKLWADRSSTEPKGEVSQRTSESIRMVWRIIDTNVPLEALALSVSDAQANEASGAELAFDVSLNRAPVDNDGAVSVSWATGDGTATAGADYTAASGALIFGTGERVKVVRVSVLDDSHDEGSETLSLTLSNAAGATLDDSEATGTISNTDVMPKAYLARFGRAVAEHALEGVAARLEAPRDAGRRMKLAGRQLGDAGGANPKEAALTDVMNAFNASTMTDPLVNGDSRSTFSRTTRSQLGSDMSILDGHDGTGRFSSAHSIAVGDALLGSSFALTGKRDASGGILAFWGKAARSNFAGADGSVDVDGDVTTTMVGADYARNQWLTGFALTRNSGYSGYSGDAGGKVISTLTAAVPYAAWRSTNGMQVWGATGFGAGEMSLTPNNEGRIDTEIGWTMAATGLRGDVINSANGPGLSLVLVSDALWTRTTSQRVEGLVSVDATVTRLRLGLESSWTFDLFGGTVVPKLEVGARHDGGDAEVGFGAEVGGGLAWTAPALGMSLNVSGRTLFAHDDSDAVNNTFSASLELVPPSLSTGRSYGPSLSLRHDVGGAATHGLEALFASEALMLNHTSSSMPGRWSMEAGWGVAAFDGRFTGTPHLGVGLAGTTRDYSIGWRLTPTARSGTLSLTLDVLATQRENIGEKPDQGIGIKVKVQ